MKDKNGIEICCENCVNYGVSLFAPPCLFCKLKLTGFKPTKEAYEARIAELQKKLLKYSNELSILRPKLDILEGENLSLEEENALLKDGKSHIMDVKISPKFVKSIIRAVNSEIKNLKKELCFTDKEIDLIRNAFQDQIREDKDGWSAEKKIIAKCNELLKERKD